MRLLHNALYLLVLLASAGALAFTLVRGGLGPEDGSDRAASPAVATVPGGEPASVADQAGSRDWPALFGTAPPEVEPEPEPEPPAPEVPVPDYVLRGLVTSGSEHLAIVTDKGRDVLIREGDEVENGWIVSQIDQEGLTLALEDREERITFGDVGILQTVSVELEDDTDLPRPASDVRTPVATPAELVAMIRRAEIERQRRGLVPVNRARASGPPSTLDR